jgi:cytochrome c peroxidase
MRMYYPIGIFVAASLIVSALAFTTLNSPKTQGEFCRLMVLENINKIEQELSASLQLIKNKGVEVPSTEQLKQHYRIARKSYKEIEFFIEYYSPFEAKFYINGPLVPKLELEISSVPFEPQGFQVIEEVLFDKNKTDVNSLKKEYSLLIEKLAFLKQHYSTINIEPNKLNEALKLQLIRIMSLTLNGYDCTINKETLTETIWSLTGVEKIIGFDENTMLEPTVKHEALRAMHLIRNAKARLKKHSDSDTFDRLNFICSYLNPIYASLNSYSRIAKIEPSLIHYAINFSNSSLFELTSIDKQHFSVYVLDTTNNHQQAELGKLLFFDPILSGNNKRACASCHQADKAFTDGRDRSLGYDGIKKLERNSPTLINAAYQKLFFHDGRVVNLEQQADEVFNNTFEMNTNPTEIIDKLKQSDEYRQLFSMAFRKTADTNITFYAVIKSITEFIKTITSHNSRFDKYLRGNKKVLNTSEKKGLIFLQVRLYVAPVIFFHCLMARFHPCTTTTNLKY